MFSGRWGFRTDVRVYQSEPEKSAQLTAKDGKDAIKYTDLIDSLQAVDTKKKLWLHPLLFNGILQTMYYFKGAPDLFEVWYGREIFKFSDGGITSLDWVVPKPKSTEEFKQKYAETQPEDWPKLMPRTRFFDKNELTAIQAKDEASTKPIVLILHGLAGGSHEPMIRNLGQLLTTGKNAGKYDVVVSNSRGCSRTKITSGALYHAHSIEDVHEVLLELKKRFPNRPIYLVGFSFGAVLLLNYLGLKPEEKLVKAAAAVAPPYDLMGGFNQINKSWGGSYLFGPGLTSFLQKLVKNNEADLHKYDPELFTQEMLTKVRNAKTFLEFDNVITCKTAGYDTVEEYYEKCSPVQVVQNISVPLLSISSTDDPTTTGLPVEKIVGNPNIAAVETDLGGHLSFLTPKKQFWAIQVVDQFIETFEDRVQ